MYRMLNVLTEMKGKPRALVDKSDVGLDGVQTIVVVEGLATSTVFSLPGRHALLPSTPCPAHVVPAVGRRPNRTLSGQQCLQPSSSRDCSAHPV